MDLLDRLLAHDAWTTRQLLLIARDLSDDQLDQQFDIGPGSLRATFLHIIRNVEVWAHIMQGHADRPDEPTDHSIPALIDRADKAHANLASLARSIRDRHAWDDKWTDHLDDPPTEKSFAGAIAHVITHSMHHRAQILHILRKLGVPDRPEGDVLSWEAHHTP